MQIPLQLILELAVGNPTIDVLAKFRWNPFCIFLPIIERFDQRGVRWAAWYFSLDSFWQSPTQFKTIECQNYKTYFDPNGEVSGRFYVILYGILATLEFSSKIKKVIVCKIIELSLVIIYEFDCMLHYT